MADAFNLAMIESVLGQVLLATLLVGLIALIIWVAVSLAAIRGSRHKTAELSSAVVLGAAVAFGYLAYVTGYLAGHSRVPVLEQVLPAVLGLIGGFGVYLFSKELNQVNPVVGIATASFAICLMIGFSMSTVQKRDQQLLRYSLPHQQSLATSEWQVNQMRAALGLPLIDFVSATPD